MKTIYKKYITKSVLCIVASVILSKIYSVITVLLNNKLAMNQLENSDAAYVVYNLLTSKANIVPNIILLIGLYLCGKNLYQILKLELKDNSCN